MILETLHKFQDAQKVIRAVEAKLYALAEAFEATGNEKVATRLCNLAADAGHAHQMVDEGTTEALTASVRDSEQATANMILATVAVAGRAVA